MRIYIWGTGKYAGKVYRSIKKESCKILGFIDNDPAKQESLFMGFQVVNFNKIDRTYDFIIISVVNYEAILYQLHTCESVDSSKIIAYFDYNCSDRAEYLKIIDQKSWKINQLEQKIEKLEQVLEARIDNAGYEIIDRYRSGFYQYPHIGNTEEAIKQIIDNGCSLVRYGDGEFEIMSGKERPVFQTYHPELAERLRNIIKEKNDKLLIGIADNYGDLEKYTQATADDIRIYMRDCVRERHMSFLDMDRIYYDAYMFKSFFPYKNQDGVERRIGLVKKIWEHKDIVIIEGSETRTGYGNDLFDYARSIKRILAPTQNAFTEYARILHAAFNISKKKLVLVALGPAGKVLVYDLMKQGYQAIDIGQIDMDYEWYRAGVQKRIPIPQKYVSQLPPAEIDAVVDKIYWNQVMDQI